MYKRENRKNEEPREIRLINNIMPNAYSSVAISYGDTTIYCTVSISDKPPFFAEEKGIGWLTAEYNMLPGSTLTRKSRPKNCADGRTVEIQRLIARSLRAAVDLTALQGKSIIIDCDVIQADGGTRTAAITGGYCALAIAVKKMLNEGKLSVDPLINQVASISAGKVDGKLLVDLEYIEDSQAEVDMNLVLTDKKEIIEVQGSGEQGVMNKNEFFELLELSENAIMDIMKLQKKFIDSE